MFGSLKEKAEKAVIQGYDHDRRIIEFYKTLIKAAREEFREDTRPSLEGFLRECHEQALKECWK